MNLKKSLRILGLALTLAMLLVFATGVVSDWNHHGPTDDAHCPYCHLGHQTPVQSGIAPSASLLKPVAFLPLPEVSARPASPNFAQTAPRAPPL